jgi:putative endonuclease
MAEHIEKGKKSEKIAAEYLKDHGYEILFTNFRYKKKEIDIISKKDNLLVIVEVKTKSFWSDERPGDIVKSGKQRYLIEATEAYMMKKDIDLEVRFDVIFVVYKHEEILIEHIEDAFGP